MPRFLVDVVLADGVNQEHWFIDAESEERAARLAVSKGGVPLAIRVANTNVWDWIHNPIGSNDRLNDGALSLFSEQLSELLSAGLTLEQGLGLLAKQDRGAAQSKLAARLLQKIRTGESLSAALSQEDRVSAVVVGIAVGAERSGDLATGLATLARHLEREKDIARRIQGALAYPAMVLAISVFAVLFILGVVIPEFSSLFAGEESRLPVITRAVLYLSDVLTNHTAALILVAIATGIFGVWCVTRVERVKTLVRDVSMRLPPVRYALYLQLARTIHVLGTLLSSGVEASEAMRLAAAVPTDDVLRKQFSDGARLMREGSSFAKAFSAMPILPSTVSTLISVGEQAGNVGRIAIRSATVLEADTNRRIDRLLALLNPVAVISLGGFVALLIASVMLGILSINQLALR